MRQTLERRERPEEAPEYPKVIETFREPSWGLSQMRQDAPSDFNGIVQVRRYRITVEEISDPPEVLAARVQALWDRCDNHHHYQRLRAAAKALGYELQGEPGRAQKTTTPGR